MLDILYVQNLEGWMIFYHPTLFLYFLRYTALPSLWPKFLRCLEPRRVVYGGMAIPSHLF